MDSHSEHYLRFDAADQRNYHFERRNLRAARYAAASGGTCRQYAVAAHADLYHLQDGTQPASVHTVCAVNRSDNKRLNSAAVYDPALGYGQAHIDLLVDQDQIGVFAHFQATLAVRYADGPCRVQAASFPDHI